MKRTNLAVLGVAGTYLAIVQAAALAQNLALRGLDPVELVDGTETLGNTSIVSQRGRFRFAFSTERNLRKFMQEPERYAPQFGGACMKMGPLSGQGSGDRFFVHDGFIYLFASDSCLEAFKANPERFIDRPDKAPRGKAEAVKTARELLAKAIQAIGGEKAIRDLRTLETRYSLTYDQNGKQTGYTRTLAISFDGSFAWIDEVGASRSGWILNRQGGFLTWEKGVPAEDSVREHMTREYYRLPLPLLRAWLEGDAHAVHTGSEKIGDANAENVAVAMMGATTTLSIDPESGRILKAAWRGRQGPGISSVQRFFADCRAVKGVKLPFTETTLSDGRPVANPKSKIVEIRVNEPIDPKLFAIPR